MLVSFVVRTNSMMGAVGSLYVDRREAVLTITYERRIVRSAQIDPRKVATPEMAEAYLRQEIAVPGADGTLSLVEAFGYLGRKGQLSLLAEGRFPGQLDAVAA